MEDQGDRKFALGYAWGTSVLGRQIVREREGDGPLLFGVGRDYMTAVLSAWNETGEALDHSDIGVGGPTALVQQSMRAWECRVYHPEGWLHCFLYVSPATGPLARG